MDLKKKAWLGGIHVKVIQHHFGTSLSRESQWAYALRAKIPLRRWMTFSVLTARGSSNNKVLPGRQKFIDPKPPLRSLVMQISLFNRLRIIIDSDFWRSQKPISVIGFCEIYNLLKFFRLARKIVSYFFKGLGIFLFFKSLWQQKIVS